MLRNRLKMLVLVALTMFVALFPATPASAYSTGRTWYNSTIAYTVDPNLGAALGITNAERLLDGVIQQWRFASAVTPRKQAPYNPNGNVITTVDLSRDNKCARWDQLTENYTALTCVYDVGTNPYVIRKAELFFSTASRWKWNTAGLMGSGPSSGRYLDFQTVALHEFGHWYQLLDLEPNGSCTTPEVMCFSYTRLKRTLHFDDKEGATQIYGPWTGFEPSNAQGYRNTLAFASSNVGGYTSSAYPPELSPVTAEFGVPVHSGTLYERLAGYAQQRSAYAYLKLFTAERDISPSRIYLEIRPGMKLVWKQYNHQRSTMAVDLVTTDGLAMRDRPNCVDQNGVRAHPASRGVYPTGQWLYFEIDLSCMAGQKIQQYMFAYDNGGNGQTGHFRAYIDDLRVQY